MSFDMKKITKIALIVAIIPTITLANDWDAGSNFNNIQDLYINGGISYDLNRVNVKTQTGSKNSTPKKKMNFTIYI